MSSTGHRHRKMPKGILYTYVDTDRGREQDRDKIS